MVDREKVVKGLEHCIEKLDTVVNKTHGFNCTACPYFRKCDRSGYLIGFPLMRDALALLKAQEPHVMTLEEYEAWIDTPFTERNPVFHEERTKRGTVTCWTNTVVCTLREYGKNDRFWTSRPTDEQREATPWDAQSQREYEAAVEMAEYCERYEPTYNAEDGSM